MIIVEYANSCELNGFGFVTRKQLVVAHKIDVGSKVTVIPNINECVRKMTSLVYDKVRDRK